MTALLNYELRITMATNFTSRKIEMICGRKMEVKTEIEMSPEVKSLLESDPKAAAQFRDVVEAIEAERRAEMEQKMNPDAKTEESDSDSEDEDEAPVDRWNSPLPGHETTCVNLIKELIVVLAVSIDLITDLLYLDGNLDEAILVRLLVVRTNHVEHERASMFL